MKTVKLTLVLISVTISSYAQTTVKESEKLATFCKVWGFLKYYHPTVAEGKLDWDQEFTDRIQALSSLTSKQEISSFYSNWITGLGPIKECSKCNNERTGSLKVNLDLKWLSDSTQFTTTLIKQLQFIQQNRNQGKNYYVQQVKGAGNTRYENEKPYKNSPFPSIEMRLLGLSRYWNIIHYFFPYKYRIGQDWNRVLVEMIPRFKDASDTTAYHLAMLELTAQIHDTHAGFSTPYTSQYFGLKWAPFKFKIIDNKAIVTGFYNDSLAQKNDIQLGDVFLTVNNRAMGDIIQEKSRYYTASNEVTQLRKLWSALFNGQTDSISATFERKGMTSQKTIHRYFFDEFKYSWPRGNKKDTCQILEGNIGYVNLGVIQPKQINEELNKLKHTTAIILDVRNNSNGTWPAIANFLNADERPFAKGAIPDLTYPGLYHYTSPYICGRKNKTPYPGKVILLFNETTQSHGEFTLMVLQTAPNVIGIGSQTAGADGNVSLITFPGDYQTYMTGIGIFYPDGGETQRVGIIPDIEVKPTIEGIKSGRDEVLEKALETIKGK